MNDFLNPKSMLTPGVAGGLVMIITNSLTSQFEIPANITALVISFTLGLVLFISIPGKIFERLVLYVLNSLVVFSVATGTNNIGISIQSPEDHAWFSRPSLISEAVAQPAQPTYDQLLERIKKLETENHSLREELSTMTSLSNEVAPGAAMFEGAYHDGTGGEGAAAAVDTNMDTLLGTGNTASAPGEDSAINYGPEQQKVFFKKW
jgi:hypothetical protein